MTTRKAKFLKGLAVYSALIWAAVYAAIPSPKPEVVGWEKAKDAKGNIIEHEYYRDVDELEFVDNSPPIVYIGGPDMAKYNAWYYHAPEHGGHGPKPNWCPVGSSFKMQWRENKKVAFDPPKDEARVGQYTMLPSVKLRFKWSLWVGTARDKYGNEWRTYGETRVRVPGQYVDGRFKNAASGCGEGGTDIIMSPVDFGKIDDPYLSQYRQLFAMPRNYFRIENLERFNYDARLASSKERDRVALGMSVLLAGDRGVILPSQSWRLALEVLEILKEVKPTRSPIFDYLRTRLALINFRLSDDEQRAAYRLYFAVRNGQTANILARTLTANKDVNERAKAVEYAEEALAKQGESWRNLWLMAGAMFYRADATKDGWYETDGWYLKAKEAAEKSNEPTETDLAVLNCYMRLVACHGNVVTNWEDDYPKRKPAIRPPAVKKRTLSKYEEALMKEFARDAGKN